MNPKAPDLYSQALSPTCLFANTSNTASRSSSSASILISSSRASFTRSRSLLSTTNIKPTEQREHGTTEVTDVSCPTPHPPNTHSPLSTPRSCTRERKQPCWVKAWQSNANPGKFVCHTLGVLEVVSPEGPNLVLATYVPYCEADILIFHCLYIKPFGGKKKVNGHWSQTPDLQIMTH